MVDALIQINAPGSVRVDIASEALALFRDDPDQLGLEEGSGAFGPGVEIALSSIPGIQITDNVDATGPPRGDDDLRGTRSDIALQQLRNDIEVIRAACH